MKQSNEQGMADQRPNIIPISQVTTLAGRSGRNGHGKGWFKVAGQNDRTLWVGNAPLAKQDAMHPVALTYPRTGYKNLNVSRQCATRFEGWSAEKIRPLLGVRAGQFLPFRQERKSNADFS